ncbi:MAG: histidine kinase [Gemmatimonadales bacterium]
MQRSRASKLRLALAVFGLTTVFGLLMFAYRYGDVLARHRSGSALERLIEEMTGAYAALPCLAVLLVVVGRLPLSRDTWVRRLPLYLGLILVLGTFETMLMWGSRSLVFPLVGLGPYDYGDLRWRIPMELSAQTIVYSMVIGLMHFGYYYRDTRRARLRAAELEAALTQAKLESLEARLEPHFIFNTLNTISAVMYEDVAEADRLLARLSDLLRRAMTRESGATVSLRDEMAWLESYLALMRERFGPRLAVRVEADPVTLDAAVPRFVLQPLVENAIRHGVGSRAGAGTVEIVAARDRDRLRLEVKDDGRGPGRSDAAGNGVGLSGTAARLALLYGDRQSFRLDERPEGGTVARITLPWSTAG